MGWSIRPIAHEEISVTTDTNIHDTTLRLSRLAFAIACAIGLAGAWFALGYHSLWFDELWTAGVVGTDHDLGAMFARNFAETNPPIYYLALFYFSQLAGVSDQALRAFSAFFGCLAIVVFVLGTRQSFSLSARLFAAALATGSYFWFFQSQNVRCYTLALAIGAGIVTIALSLLRDPSRPPASGKLAALAALMLLGSFTHFYVAYQSLGVLLVLLFYRRPLWPYVGAMSAVLVGSLLLYRHFAIAPYSQIDPNNFWFPRDLSWYPLSLRSIVQLEWRRPGVLALGLCVAAIAIGYVRQRRRSPDPAVPARSLARDRVLVLVATVPVIVLAAGFLSSVLIAPNFSDRNFLTCAPFLWAFSARLYDLAQEAEIGRAWRAGLNAALAFCVLAMAQVVVHRVSDSPVAHLWYQPFRQAAEAVRAEPACRGATIPVIVVDPKGWYRGDYGDRLFAHAYGYYLRGHATPRPVFIEDIRSGRLDAALADEMRARLGGQGCPVVALGIHRVYEGDIPIIRSELLKALGVADVTPDRLATRVLKDGWWGFIFAAPSSAAR